MYFLALATDFDGTLAQDGVVDAISIAALERLKATGRRLVLVTGRELPDLKRAFPEISLFDRVVAENGAIIYDPATKNERIIAPAPSADLVELLKRRHVTPLSVGHSIVATWEPHQVDVLEAIRELGLELQIIFNKGAVMALPPGVNKATGLSAALEELGLSPHNVVAVGDAENDHAFLQICGCAAAVANALPKLKESANIKLAGDHGSGVVELIQHICSDDSRLADASRNGILFGTAHAGGVFLEPYRGNILIAGTSGIGKSTLATALTERMTEKLFTFCIFDPEGDYTNLENAVSIGNSENPPTPDEAMTLLRQHLTNVVIDTQALRVEERPGFFAALLPRISALRAKVGRPHWLVIDEAHHLLPAQREDAAKIIPEELKATIFVTVHPEALATAALKTVEVVIAVGSNAPEVISNFCSAIDLVQPELTDPPGSLEVLFWRRSSGELPRRVKPERPHQVHRRHTRKYAEGTLGEDRSFFFRGPDNTLNLRVHNLLLFVQIADGIDDRTWTHHLKQGDYSNWFREAIKDEGLAEDVRVIEQDATLDARGSRQRVADAVSRRYTAPAATHG